MDEPTGAMIWYGGSSLLLALLLFFPLRRLIWIWRMRGLERKLGRPGTEEERQAERRRAGQIGGVIAITFAFLFNRVLLGSV